MTKDPTEKQIQDSIIEYLNYKGHFVWRQNTGMFFLGSGSKQRAIRASIKGASDIIGVAKDGRIICIEVKKQHGKVSDYQKDFLNRVHIRGGYSFVAYSLEDVQKMGL